MTKFIAIIACFVELLAYMLISQSLGFSPSGGFLPGLVAGAFWMLVVLPTWHLIHAFADQR
jgi:hypothetical protein